MYSDTVQILGDQAVAKLAGQKRSILSHLIRSMLAGMYVGAAIVLIFTIGGSLSREAPGAVRLLEPRTPRVGRGRSTSSISTRA